MHGIQERPAHNGEERKRVEAVVQTLAHLQSQGDTLAAVAHDARNMVTALELYCDLLEEPGVLAEGFAHYGGELRLVAAASRRLVEKLMALENAGATQPSFWRGDAPAGEQWPAQMLSSAPAPRGRWEAVAAEPVENLAEELLATRNLLAALAGPGIAVTVDAKGGARPARISSEDLTRVLVNLVRNAVEAMPSGGRIHIGLSESAGEDGRGWLRLTVEDNGPGIAPDALERIFEAGYSGHSGTADAGRGEAAAHRGLGLAIARSIVEQAGGRIAAENRALGGARMVLELPSEPAR
ncbi:MAG: sensor histidine kinase [Acidobacteriota bacterium]